MCVREYIATVARVCLEQESVYFGANWQRRPTTGRWHLAWSMRSGRMGGKHPGTGLELLLLYLEERMPMSATTTNREDVVSCVQMSASGLGTTKLLKSNAPTMHVIYICNFGTSCSLGSNFSVPLGRRLRVSWRVSYTYVQSRKGREPKLMYSALSRWKPRCKVPRHVSKNM